MAVETADDRAAFLNPDEFGVEASYNPETGATVTLNGIFDDPYGAVFDGAPAGVSSSTPVFTCRSADLPPHLSQDGGDTLTIDGTIYEITDIQPDGTGMTTLALKLTGINEDDDGDFIPSLDFSVPANSMYIALIEDL